MRSPFELLVAVVLSAQATDKSVNKATAAAVPGRQHAGRDRALGVDGLIPYISRSASSATRRRTSWRSSQILLREHGGEVPADREALEALPGVGRKTANVVLNIAFGQPTIAVDTHIFRVANRTGHRARQGRRRGRAQARRSSCPDEFKRSAHHWLILHGRYVCVARTPRCPECIIRDLCEYRHKTPGPAPALPLS